MIIIRKKKFLQSPCCNQTQTVQVLSYYPYVRAHTYIVFISSYINNFLLQKLWTPQISKLNFFHRIKLVSKSNKWTDRQWSDSLDSLPTSMTRPTILWKVSYKYTFIWFNGHTYWLSYNNSWFITQWPYLIYTLYTARHELVEPKWIPNPAAMLLFTCLVRGSESKQTEYPIRKDARGIHPIINRQVHQLPV